ncbi:MAG: oxygen-independent coproporphyrinogen III oxidase, partial [Bacteroides sp.]
GYQRSKEEQITGAVIETLLCNYAIAWEEVAKHLNISKDELLQAIRYQPKELKEFEQDGLIEWSDKGIQMTSSGKLFVRNVAASLDKLLVNTTKKFSKPV